MAIDPLPFLLFSLGLALYFGLHSLLAAEQVKAFISRYLPLRYYRIGYNLVAIILLLPLYLAYRRLPGLAIWEEDALAGYLGMVIVILGGVVILLALRRYDLGEFSGLRQLRSTDPAGNDQLQTGGLNRWVRHPLYFGTLLLLWGFFLHQGNWPALLLAVISTGYIIIGARLEERKLLRQYGKAYAAYCRQVPMLLPNCCDKPF